MGWSGPCARTMLVQPFQISPRSKTHQYLRNVPMHSVRGRREAGDDSGIWSDGLGIPWGIPDHYKALNPAANGLASTLCPWCVIGAHTDWINFLYYAEMKFQNLTRDGLQKIREELHANSRLTRQNTAVLEILTAMNGGICVMLGTDQCCTYVPDNTRDGKDLDLILQKMQKVVQQNAWWGTGPSRTEQRGLVWMLSEA